MTQINRKASQLETSSVGPPPMYSATCRTDEAVVSCRSEHGAGRVKLAAVDFSLMPRQQHYRSLQAGAAWRTLWNQNHTQRYSSVLFNFSVNNDYFWHPQWLTKINLLVSLANWSTVNFIEACALNKFRSYKFCLSLWLHNMVACFNAPIPYVHYQCNIRTTSNVLNNWSMLRLRNAHWL